MNKKIITIAVMLVMGLGCLCACGSSENADITSSWTLVEMSVSGKTTTYDIIPVTSIDPHFSCTDGKNFTFSSNGKTHTGTLTESNGIYTLDLNDSNRNMEAKISGNKMTISIVGTSAYFVFETK
ncbi:MAG: hypothetical protein ACI4A3_11375 [Lachnospiraceae bacterium]